MRAPLLLTLAFVGLTAVAAVADRPATAQEDTLPPEWHIVHWDSVDRDGFFEEQFRVVGAATVIAVGNVTALLDGAPLDVAWSTETLDVGTVFSFHMEAFDVPSQLQLHHEGELLWEGRFGGGGGTPVLPA